MSNTISKQEELYLNSDAIGLAENIRNGNITAEECAEIALNMIEKVNPKLNAVNQIFSEEDIKKQIKNCNPEKPFAGVPILIKDLGAALNNYKTTQGSVFFKDYIPDYTSVSIERLQQAGFILIGKTTSPELGLSFVTESKLLGATRNPLDLNVTTGGSSGGAAAAVAAKIVPVAHASDGGGSIRVPASCCGLVGLKPTRARVSCGPLFGELWSGLAGEGVLSRTVRDTAACLDILAGSTVGDPYFAPYKTHSWLEQSKRKPKALKVAFHLHSPFGQPVDPALQQAAHTAALLLEQMGHSVEENFPIFEPETMAAAMGIIVAGTTAWNVRGQELTLGRQAKPEELEAHTWLLVEQGRQLLAEDYAKALFLMQRESRKIAPFFEKYDVLITPSLAQLPVPIGSLMERHYPNIESYHEAMGAFSPFTALWNQTGQPALTYPVTKTANGFPLSAQFITKFGDEVTLLQIAQCLEEHFKSQEK